MGTLQNEFDSYRTKMNDRIMETANTNIKRFFALDTTTYADGALDVKTKEMLGLVASMVLRCDDCIKYHLGKCHEAGVNHDEIISPETQSIRSSINRHTTSCARNKAGAPSGHGRVA